MKIGDCAATVIRSERKVRYSKTSNFKLPRRRNTINQSKYFIDPCKRVGVFLILSPETATISKTRSERLYYARPQTVGYLGELAISQEDLGLNDPITHLDRYARAGEETLPSIREDLDTLILEMLPDPFENAVDFVYQAGDFISAKDQVGLKKITSVNKTILEKEAHLNPQLLPELVRAQAEAREPYAVEEWFKTANVGGVMIAESLPMGKQEFAVVRLHFKTGSNTMQEYIVSLHSPTINTFNSLRKRLGVDRADAKAPIELLATPYPLELSADKTSKEFVDFYVSNYDSILSQNSPSAEKYCYGVAGLDRSKIKTNFEKVRQENPVKEIYIDALKAFSKSNGYANEKIIGIAESLHLEHKFHDGQRLRLGQVRANLKDILQALVSTYDKADNMLMQGLAGFNTGTDYVYGAVAGFGDQARAENRVYDSACPTVDRQAPSTESSVISNGYNLTLVGGQLLKDFGEAKKGICRTKSCLSRGFGTKANKTIVGGCDFCVECHKMLQHKKTPETEHAKKRRKIQAKPNGSQ